MGLYIPEKNKEVIHIKDIDEFAHALKEYVDTYYNNIFIQNEKELERLDRLNSIADALLQRRFMDVFEPFVEVDYGDHLLFEIPF